ncbi:MAG: hypothetical protein Q9193_005261, partial [Seirophora villosa]
LRSLNAETHFNLLKNLYLAQVAVVKMAPIFTEDFGKAHHDYAANLDGDWEEVLGEERMSCSADFTRWNPFETLLMHPTSTEGLDREMCSKAYYEVKFLYHCLWQLERHRDPELLKPGYSPPRVFEFMWRCLYLMKMVTDIPPFPSRSHRA